MDKDDNFNRIGSSGDNHENSEYVSYYSDGGESIDLDEFEAKYYDDFEITARVLADFNTIKEKKSGVKKVVFSKQGEAMKRYDPKLVLK